MPRPRPCRRSGVPTAFSPTSRSGDPAAAAAYDLPTPRVAGLEVDLVFPEQRVAVEADSGAYHGTRAAFDRARERDAILTRTGYRVLRFSDTRIEHGRATVAAALDDREPALSARALQA